jgi:archaellum biogenesis protein FlaJ (TadC family)
VSKLAIVTLVLGLLMVVLTEYAVYQPKTPPADVYGLAFIALAGTVMVLLGIMEVHINRHKVDERGYF